MPLAECHFHCWSFSWRLVQLFKMVSSLTELLFEVQPYQLLLLDLKKWKNDVCAYARACVCVSLCICL